MRSLAPPLALVLLAAVGISTPPVTPAAAAAPGALPTAAVPTAWTATGAGWGHGVGMSQYGARAQAEAGRSAAQILGFYYAATSYDVVPDTREISVNLQHAVTSTALRTSALSSGGGRFSLTAGSTTLTGTASSRVSLTRSGASVRVVCTGCSVAAALGPSVTVTWDDGRTLLHVDGKRLKDGSLRVVPSTASTTALETVGVFRIHDEYLDYIAEMPWSWPREALKAQAAAARSYAMSRGFSTACACHIYGDQRGQVFNGYPDADALPYWPQWRAAVAAAGRSDAGYVVRHAGTIASTYYSSSSGGRTQANEDVWGGAPVPYLRSVADPWSLQAANPNRSWTLSVPQTDLARAFALDDVVRLDLSRRTVAGAVATAVATSSDGTRRSRTGSQLRSALALKSTWLQHGTARLGGADRYAVSAAVAQRIPAAEALVLASGENASLADASVGGPLAAALGGPLLLTRREGLPASTLNELTRRAGSLRTVHVVGGPGAVSERVVTTLRARGLSVVRHGGSDRYGTSLLVMREIHQRQGADAVVVASGLSLVDALAASGPAAARTEPIILSRPGGLAPATVTELSRSGVSSARVIGGTGVLATTAEQSLRAGGLSTVRLAGNDRFASAAAVARFYRPLLPTATEVVLTSGADSSLVDSLSAGTLGRIIVLTQRDALPAASAGTLQESLRLSTVTAVGGTAVIPDATLRQAALS